VYIYLHAVDVWLLGTARGIVNLRRGLSIRAIVIFCPVLINIHHKQQTKEKIFISRATFHNSSVFILLEMTLTLLAWEPYHNHSSQPHTQQALVMTTTPSLNYLKV